MKKFVTLMMALTLTLLVAGAQAESACGGYSAEKAAACGEKDDTKTCCAASATTECDAGMAKGGAAQSDVKSGYALGDVVPDFALPDSAGKDYKLADFDSKIKMVLFYNQQCPYIHEARERISQFAEQYKDKGVVLLAVDAGTNNSAESIAEEQKSVPFPILVNSDSNLARKFDASHTPTVYLLNRNNEVVYTGKFDSGEADAAGNRETPAKDAVDALLAGEEVPVKQTKAFGCKIKYKPLESAN